jgi:hypothetical protein
MNTDAQDRYVFLTDGIRYTALVKVVISPSGIYVIDPNDPRSGKISYHESGAFNLAQPKYDPQILYGELEAPEAVHGYQYIARRMYGTRPGALLPGSADSPGPSTGRPGPVVDLRGQPEGTRFLEVEVGIRCEESCHPGPDCMFPSRRFLRDSTPLGSRLMVISASWLPLFEFGRPPISNTRSEYTRGASP